MVLCETLPAAWFTGQLGSSPYKCLGWADITGDAVNQQREQQSHEQAKVRQESEAGCSNFFLPLYCVVFCTVLLNWLPCFPFSACPLSLFHPGLIIPPLAIALSDTSKSKTSN